MDLLKQLPFDKISEDFVNYVIDSEYSERDVEHIELNNDWILQHIQKTNRVFREQLQSNKPLRNWRQLIEQDDIQHNKCLCLIFYLVNSGQTREQFSYKLVFETSSLYMLLISIPLSRTMNIFNQNLYLKCLETILLLSTDKKNGHVLLRSKHSIIYFLQDLGTAFKHFDLKDTYSLENTMRCLITTAVSLNSTVQEFSMHIYRAISELCVFHNSDTALMSIVKYFAPFLSMSEHQNLTSAELTMNLKYSIKFMSSLMEKFGHRMTDIILKLSKRLTVLCAETAAYADIRRKRGTVVTSLVHALPFKYYNEYMQWFGVLTSSTKKQHRVFAQHIILQLLPVETSTGAGNSTDPDVSLETEDTIRLSEIITSHKKVLKIIIDRCYDTNDEVVTRAIQNLCEAFRMRHMNDLLVHMFSPEAPSNPLVDTTDLPTFDEMNRVLLHYLREDKVSLRRSALQLTEHVAVNKPRSWLNKSLMDQFVVMIRDPAISVRQHVLTVLTQFVNKYMLEDNELLHIWLENVLPEANESVSGLDTRIYAELSKMLLDKLEPFPNFSEQSDSVVPWILLEHIRSLEWEKYLDNAVEYWNKKNSIRPSLITNLQSYLNSKYKTEALMFLASIAKLVKLSNVTFAADLYNQYMSEPITVKESEEPLTSMFYVLQILRSKHTMSTHDKYELSVRMIRHLTTWKDVPVNLVTDLMDTVSCLQNNTEWREHYSEIACDAVKAGLSALQDDVPFDVMKFESGLLFYVDNKEAIRKLPFRELAIRLCHKINTDEQAMIVLYHKENTLHKTMLLALARICLRDDDIAYDAVPVFFKILNRHGSANIQIVCLIILLDLCTLYTQLIEPHVEIILSCLLTEVRVRTVAVRVITELLADGYLKFRGDNMICFLSMILDDEPKIRSVVDYFIMQKAVVQNRDMLHALLVEVIHFHNIQSSNTALCKAFACNGDEKLPKRMELYHYMIFNMRGDLKLRVIRTLYTNVLASWTNELNSLSTSHDDVSIVRDVLLILSFEELRPQNIESAVKRSEPEQEDLCLDAEEVEDVAMEKKKMMLLEMMTPILVNFKTKCLTRPEFDTLKDVFQSYVQILSVDYKKQIKKFDTEWGTKLL